MKVTFEQVKEWNELIQDCTACNYGLDETAPMCDTCLDVDLTLRTYGF